MSLYDEICDFTPGCEQEARDQEQILHFMETCDNYLDRHNLTAHFSASLWTVNADFSRTLMVYHNIYDSWSWIGGHADGESDLRSVALRELQEETGVSHARFVMEDIFSLETLPVFGHEKRGVYVPTHLHLNVTYLAVADEHDPLLINHAENQGVRWFTLEDALTAPSEKWMVERIYRKLTERTIRMR